jgi:hypothetical protein
MAAGFARPPVLRLKPVEDEWRWHHRHYQKNFVLVTVYAGDGFETVTQPHRILIRRCLF